eukprot:TRINITY_DN743_c0_g3_i2.p1 TRINITY_DN743_c0_g3~~TRINITY_DN743_c0_g3_i2.p1  ORF type:complete len:556 (+),score=159.18 TRINITY_DN743_c0_g3_i2:1185-2852(+)
MRCTRGLRLPVTTDALDRVLSNNVKIIKHADLPPVLTTDSEAARYLDARFKLKGREMPEMAYDVYAGVRRGLEDTMQALRRGGVAGERTYLTGLVLCNKLNFRSKIAMKFLKAAVEDKVILSPEAFAEVIRSTSGKEGGPEALLYTLKLLSAQDTALNPNVTYAILKAANGWGSKLLVFKIAAELTANQVASAVPYTMLLSSCETPQQALVIARDMKNRGVCLDTAAYVSILSSCVHAADVPAAEKVFKHIPRVTEKAEYWERLAAVHHAAADVVGVENVVLRMLHNGMEVTERVFILLISAYARRGDVVNMREAYAAFPQFQDHWSVQTELMTGYAILGDTKTADLIWDARPQASRHSHKVSSSQLYRYRDAYYVSKLDTNTGAWGVMCSTMSHHAVGWSSYCILYSAIRKIRRARLGTHFGFNAVKALAARLRSLVPPTNENLVQYGNFASPEIDKALYGLSVHLNVDAAVPRLHESVRAPDSLPMHDFEAAADPTAAPTLTSILDAMLRGTAEAPPLDDDDDLDFEDRPSMLAREYFDEVLKDLSQTDCSGV